jgi:VCBS repeat-containing protein
LGILCPGISHGAGPPPVITVQPWDTNVQKSAIATFSVTASSGTTLSYQWYFGTNLISSATGSTLTRTNVMPGEAGLYYVAVKNSGGTVNSRQATLTVLNTPPVANDDVYNLTAVLGTVLPLSVGAPGVLANDTDTNHDALTAVLVSTPSHGSLSFNANGSFTYSPDLLYSGSDSFTYQANDGISLGNVATVYFNIALLNQPPVAANQSVVVPNYLSTNLVLQATDPDSPNLIYSIVSGPTNGVLTGLIASTGAVTYTPASNYFGADFFRFAAFDGSLYSTGQVSLTIQSPPAVSGRSASSITTSSANLRANVNPQGLATAYWFQYGVTTNYGSFSATNSLSAGANFVAVQTPITGLTPGTLYHFCVLAANPAGTVSGPDVTFTTDYPPPLATTLPASDIAPNSVTLNAAVNPQGASTKCYFQYGVTTNYGSFSTTNSLPSGSNSVAVASALAGLAPGSVFHYCVVARSSGGTAIGQDATVTLPVIPPFQCTVTTTSPGGNMQLSLSSVSGASFTVLSSTNVAMSVDNWTVLGSMTEMSPGQYQFIDPQPSTNPQCYYRVRSP